MRSIALAVEVSDGAVPDGNVQYAPHASVRDPVPSCTTNIEPVCPGAKLVGLAIVRLPPSVTVKEELVLKSGVIVAASVSVSIAPGKTSVKSVLVFGDVSVMTPVPLALPWNLILLISASYTMVQTEPDGTVTDIPEFTVIGPALIALLPVEMT